jgi:hypothetical protein
MACIVVPGKIPLRLFTVYEGRGGTMIGNPACEYAICVIFCLKFSIKSDPKMCQTRSGLLRKSDAFLPTFGRIVNGRLILELQRNVTFTLICSMLRCKMLYLTYFFTI